VEFFLSYLNIDIRIHSNIHSYSVKLSTNQFQAVGPNRAGIVSLSDDAAAIVSSNVSDLTKSSISIKWIPQTFLRTHQNVNGNLIRTQEDKDNDVFRRCRALLNKLTPEKFEKLADDLAHSSFGIDSPHLLKGVILLIFDKALAEPNYCSLCKLFNTFSYCSTNRRSLRMSTLVQYSSC
jgi:hypothetical protein